MQQRLTGLHPPRSRPGSAACATRNPRWYDESIGREEGAPCRPASREVGGGPQRKWQGPPSNSGARAPAPRPTQWGLLVRVPASRPSQNFPGSFFGPLTSSGERLPTLFCFGAGFQPPSGGSKNPREKFSMIRWESNTYPGESLEP